MEGAAVYLPVQQDFFAVSTLDSCAFLSFFETDKEAFFDFEQGIMSDRKLTRADCLVILKEKYAALKKQGVDRYPRRSDFSDSEVVAIKAFLGPWPRALEAAGIKPPRNDDRIQRNREKRIRAKRRRTMALKMLEKEKLNPNDSESGK